MSIAKMLQEQAKKRGVPLWIMEKDYAMSYLLAGITSTPELGEHMALKGGTALRKAYFKEYRFSEDLDYSTLVAGQIPELDAFISRAARFSENLLRENGPFSIQVERLMLREPHPADQAAFTVRIQFPYQRSPMCRLKIEITVDEPVLLIPERRPVFHDFEEPFSAIVNVYPLVEIVAEKLRALLQSRDRLRARGWGASRVCRDYYDLWEILGSQDFINSYITNITTQKCKIKKIDFQSPLSFFAPELIALAKAEWEKQLQPFVYHCPKAELVLHELETMVISLWE